MTGETSAETTAPTADVIGDTSNTDETDMNTQETSVTDETEYGIAPIAYDDDNMYVPELEGDTYVIDLSRITIDADVEIGTSLVRASCIEISVDRKEDNGKDRDIRITANIRSGCKVKLTGSPQVTGESLDSRIKVIIEINNKGEITDFSCTKNDSYNSYIGFSVTNHGTISGGTYDCSVDNDDDGVITGGNFNKTVHNDGTISDGNFNNNSDYVVVLNYGTINGGTFQSDVVLNQSSDGGISGGDFRNVSEVSWYGGFVTGGIFKEGAGVPEGSSYISWNESTKTYTVHGEVTLDNTFVLSAGETLVIPGGAKVNNLEELRSSGNINGNVIEPHTHTDGTTFTPWTDTTKLPDTAGNWYLTGNVTLTGTWSVPTGVTNLCLNGKSITNADDNDVINIGENAVLNIYDEEGDKGSITGSGNKGAININSGELTVNGGTIENSANFTIYGSSAKIIINGGTITNSGDGTAVYNIFSTGSVIITGGNIIGGENSINIGNDCSLEIRNNARIVSTAKDSSGLFFRGRSFKLSGSPEISGTKASIKLNEYSSQIDIDGALTNTEPYVIDMNKPGVFAAGAYAAQSKDKFKPSDELANEGYEVIVTEGNELAMGIDIDYPHEVKPGENFKTDNGTITNKDGTVELKDEDGNKTTVTLPDTSDSVEVDESGNVTVPAGSKVQTGGTEVTLPKGGTIDKDGTITADEIQIGDVTVTGDDVTVDKDGNIKVPNGGTVQTGGTEVTLPKGGTIDKDGKVTVPNDSIISVTKSNVTVEYADNAKFTDEKNNYSVSESNGFILLDIDDKSSEKININGFEVKAAYDITLLYNGKTKVQPSGKVKVTLDVPTDVDIEKARVFHENSYDGFDEITVTERASRTLSFEAKHFSIYVIATAVAPSVPDSPGSSGNTDPTDEPVDDNDNNNNSNNNNNNNNSSNNNNNGSSGGTPTAPKEQTKLINISVDNKINGKTSVVISRMTDNVITAELGKEFNGLFANVFTEGGDLIYASEIKDGIIKFTYTKDEKLVIVIDSISYAEDLTAGAGEFSSENEIVENSGAKTAVCVSTVFAAAILTGIVLKRKKQ